jgi:pimeloyl-ACP methyl ester carboxylesterase
MLLILIVACSANKEEIQYSTLSIDTLFGVRINGDLQKVLIQSDDSRNPILLYLHGGPGSSTIMLSHSYSDSLRKYFTFVNWDQRGAGLSYSMDTDPESITEKQIEDDAIELIRFLLEKYNQPKLFVLGHSFGSIIGLRMASKYPEYFYAYIGMGQVLDWDKSVEITRHWLVKELTKAGDQNGLRKLEATHSPSMELVRKYRGHTFNPVNFDSIITSSPYYVEGYLGHHRKAREFTEKNIHINPCPNCDNSSLYDLEKIAVPVYFLEGRHDHVPACAPELVVTFCEKLNAPEKSVIWFENSAHLPNLEEPYKFQEVLIHIRKESKNHIDFCSHGENEGVN